MISFQYVLTRIHSCSLFWRGLDAHSEFQGLYHASVNTLQVLKVVKKLQDEDGNLRCAQFLELPARHEYPDYFQSIKKPITLTDIDTRIQKQVCRIYMAISTVYTYDLSFSTRMCRTHIHFCSRAFCNVFMVQDQTFYLTPIHDNRNTQRLQSLSTISN